jgi:biotin operon repressor
MAHGPAQHAGRLRPLRCASRGSRAVPLVTRGPGRALRLARLRERLADRPRGVGELARSLGVTRRTIERDLQTLRDEMGVPVEVDDQHRYSIESAPSLSTTSRRSPPTAPCASSSTPASASSTTAPR